MTARTIKTRYDAAEKVTVPDDTDIIGGVYDASAATTKVMDLTALQSWPFLAALATASAANTAAISAVSSQGGIVAQRNTASGTVTNTTTRTSIETNATPSPSIPMAAGDRILYSAPIHFLNSTGGAVNCTVSVYIKGAVEMSAVLSIPSASSSVMLAFVDVEVTWGTTGVLHYKRGSIKYTAMTTGTIDGATGFVAVAGEVIMSNLPGSTDWLMVFPSWELDVQWASASTSLSARKYPSTLTLVRNS